MDSLGVRWYFSSLNGEASVQEVPFIMGGCWLFRNTICKWISKSRSYAVAGGLKQLKFQWTKCPFYWFIVPFWYLWHCCWKYAEGQSINCVHISWFLENLSMYTWRESTKNWIIYYQVFNKCLADVAMETQYQHFKSLLRVCRVTIFLFWTSSFDSDPHGL